MYYYFMRMRGYEDLARHGMLIPHTLKKKDRKRDKPGERTIF